MADVNVVFVFDFNRGTLDPVRRTYNVVESLFMFMVQKDLGNLDGYIPPSPSSDASPSGKLAKLVSLSPAFLGPNPSLLSPWKAGGDALVDRFLNGKGGGGGKLETGGKRGS